MNFSSIIILMVLLLIISLAIYSVIKDKEKGKSSCGGKCTCCGRNALCHDSKSIFREMREKEFQKS